ncbi:MAG: NAD(P)H-hydrate dehydratase [Gammaproteobacteria bacterium]|nr:NAD(P)H-hydrate dehydratase [Gammaproteobacteria bacterium]
MPYTLRYSGRAMQAHNQGLTPVLLYTTAQVRELDRLAIEEAGIPGYTLMSRAGEVCWEALRARWPQARSLLVLCGTGNNGGDGFIVARLALAENWPVQVLQLGASERLQGDALTAHADFVAAGGQVSPFTVAASLDMDIIIDAMLGTGVDRPLAGDWQLAVERVNQSARPVLAVDLPTGLHADTGAVSGATINADMTVTFIGRKAGLYTGVGPDYAGETRFADLDVPGTVYQQVSPAAQLVRQAALGPLAGPRVRTAHKGQHGQVLVIGGGEGMAGAARLAGEGALRSGAGLVSLATHPGHAAFVGASCPELICHAVATAQQLRRLIQSASVLLVGPGLGRSSWAQTLLAAVLEASQPLVIDADALNLLASTPARRTNQVLTPHPGEAARLLHQDTAAIQRDRFAAAQAITLQYGGTTVLKGAGSVIHADDKLTAVCGAGNPGMATAGMGDVLAGVIAALIAQGMDTHTAAVAGVCAHACAGDAAAVQGERGMLARDVVAELRGVLNGPLNNPLNNPGHSV